jgi:hypothetical protein
MIVGSFDRIATETAHDHALAIVKALAKGMDAALMPFRHGGLP